MPRAAWLEQFRSAGAHLVQDVHGEVKASSNNFAFVFKVSQ